MGGHLDQGGLQQLDEDKYDKFCDHLIVIDKAGNKIVGTYRLLLGQKANKIGFYSERFFNIENIKKLAGDKEMLELGRSCIHRDYRDRLVINLLWNGISKYIKEQNVRFAFGSVRLGSAEPLEVSRMFKLIKEKFYAPEEYRVLPKRKNIVKGLNMNIKISDPRSIWRTLPALVKGYLRTGVVVCGPPAVNPDFGSVVVFVLLDVDKMSPSYKRHFF
jgi:putative hemolysin